MDLLVSVAGDWRLAPAAAIVLLAGCVRGFSGFGAGLVIMPPFALLYDPATAVVTAGLVDAPAVIQLLPQAWRHADRRQALVLGLAAAAGIPFGVWLLVTLDADVIRRVAAIVILAFVVALALGWRYRRRPRLPVAAATGVTGGVLGGATSLLGPPVILYCLAGPMPALQARGTLLGYFTIASIVQLTALAAGGVMTWEMLVRGLMLTPLYLVGIAIGSRIFRVAAERLFRRIAMTLLVLIAVAALVG